MNALEVHTTVTKSWQLAITLKEALSAVVLGIRRVRSTMPRARNRPCNAVQAEYETAISNRPQPDV